ncbi:hypothetical protein E1301_Tti015927 [Triplophysa tibetana]|uniref:Uncharacterized protein n=1 Tax=Triplophysa tibetana TaxID=1572043 RepID=A0A5A9PBQ6_9TELE|nr:hypothetical protein E1301_Tti015927 [Triplophysa tibetana]
MVLHNITTSSGATMTILDPHDDQVVVVNVENVRNNEEVPTERVINDEVSESVRKDEESSVENELMDDGDVEVQMSETKVDSRIEGRMSRDCVVTRSGRNEDQRSVRELLRFSARRGGNLPIPHTDSYIIDNRNLAAQIIFLFQVLLPPPMCRENLAPRAAARFARA